MKSSIFSGGQVLHFNRIVKNSFAAPLLVFIFLFQAKELKSQNCSSCCLTSFPALTVYQSFQTNRGLGVGIEAGNWRKDTGKFSFFIGTSMIWTQTPDASVKTASSPRQMLLSFYVKGQYKIANHLYVVAAPGVVNLSYFDLQTGIRYVIPVTKIFGIGIEPSYSFNQKVMVLNANLHFALR